MSKSQEIPISKAHTGSEVDQESLSALQKYPKLGKRILVLLVVLVVLWAGGNMSRSYTEAFVVDFDEKVENAAPPLPTQIQYAWGPYAPWHPAADAIPSLPPTCEVTQVNIIQRHGARFPTSTSGAKIKKALKKLKKAREFTIPQLKFLRNFKYDLSQDQLVPFGAAQSFEAGQIHFERYAYLVSENTLPFVRASGIQRVIDSASNWTAGFAAASDFKIVPFISVILDESLNNTLTNKMCPNAGDSDVQTKKWQGVFAKRVAQRLNNEAPGAHLHAEHAVHLMSLCPFETVAKQTPSKFCNLFSQDEFDAYEYDGDLDKFYGTGYGQRLGRVQGVGYVNELLARLTNRPVQDHTQTNTTLDSSPMTFPLNRTIYADFSHDNQMAAIYATLGLFNQSKPLNPKVPNAERTWIASKLVPFSARMVTEKVHCSSDKEYVRILVNDAVQPLEFCGAQEDGLCELEAFIDSQEYARSNGAGDWEKCFN